MRKFPNLKSVNIFSLPTVWAGFQPFDHLHIFLKETRFHPQGVVDPIKYDYLSFGNFTNQQLNVVKEVIPPFVHINISRGLDHKVFKQKQRFLHLFTWHDGCLKPTKLNRPRTACHFQLKISKWFSITVSWGYDNCVSVPVSWRYENCFWIPDNHDGGQFVIFNW